ncbi:MAG: alpha/beta hydrolase fold domain-containing protein [Pseudomonadales bacterium]
MSKQPGRLGDPNMTLATDPRLDPRIKAVIEMAGDLAPGVDTPAAGASYEDGVAYTNAFEAAGAAMHEAAWAMMPAFDDIEISQQTIAGVDGNDITLHIHRAKTQTGPAPCIVHTHGGGMVLMTAEDPGFVRLRNDLARAGNVVVGVEFRNGGGRLGNHPFPAGLNDCASAVQWVHDQRAALQLSSIVVSGESGGGNLAIATTLKAKQEGWSDRIDGVYAMCPYISGQYAPPAEALPSLIENDDYMLNGPMMAVMVTVYDPTGAHRGNPLAWPLHASSTDLAGLPPHVVSVNELDPLRDEGLSFYRNLLAAGVSAVARTVHGTPHAGDGTFPDFVPDIYQETVRSISGFARSVAS